MRKIKFKKIR